MYNKKITPYDNKKIIGSIIKVGVRDRAYKKISKK